MRKKRAMKFQFNPKATGWDINNALSLAMASELAYEQDMGKVTTTLGAWGFDPDRIVFLNRSHTQGFVAGNATMVLVSFRGTESTDLWDWMSDAHIELDPAPAGLLGRVHRGFAQALKGVQVDLEEAIRKFQDNQSLWFTGHSLGAALAALAKTQLGGGLYTFGQPRVGDSLFCRSFDYKGDDRPSFRVVNDGDIVTRIPPRAFGYSHFGQSVFIDAAGKLRTEGSWWSNFLREVTVGIEGLQKPASLVKEHAISLYVKNLAKNL